MNVAVSGVAGDIGFGIARILREWKFFEYLYGIDISDENLDFIIFDHVEIAPHANEQNYMVWLADYIKRNQIDFFIPTSESEISAISNNLSMVGSLCKILINDEAFVTNCLDKFRTLKYLAAKGVKVPVNGTIVDGSKPICYPAIVKPRSGQGSKGVRKISTEAELSKDTEGYVWQEYLVPGDQEYTVPVYVSKAFEKRVLLLKRVLMGGRTKSAIVVKNIEIEQYVDQIIEAWNIFGLYNIQLRLTEKGPLLFEINPRISSTVDLRDKLGFEDLKWWVLETLDMEIPHYNEVAAGTRICRGCAE